MDEDAKAKFAILKQRLNEQTNTEDDEKDTLLKGLNPKQKEAVLENDAPLLVFAGAGSGKTRVVTTKIAYCINELGFQPWQILAVTFTNRACKEMLERVTKLVPEVDPKQLYIKTFHAFGAYMLHLYGSNLGLGDNFKIYDDEDSATLLTQIYPDSKKRDMKIVAHRISKAKDMMRSPSEFKKEVDFYQQYTRYENALRNTGNVDFADLILLPIKLFDENKDIQKKVQNKFKVILVDEYQDSNIGQFALLKSLVGPNNFICVVGDDDQSIYRFRGAEVKNILSFEKVFPGTKVVKLEENYRSTKSILAVADAVIKKNVVRTDKTLYSNRGEGKKPVVITLEDERREAAYIAKVILGDNNFEGSAILYRTNAQSQVFESTFNSIGIPYKIVGALRFYDREEIKDAVALLAFLINPRDSISFSRMVGKINKGVGKTSIQKILEQAALDNIDLISASTKTELKGKAKEGVKKFTEEANLLSQEVGKEVNSLLIEKVMKDFGLIEYYQKRDKDEGNIDNKRVNNLQELVNILSRDDFSNGFDGLNHFFEEAALDPTQMASDENRNKRGVTLITMHNTKGLEFDRVFIVGLEENLIPGRNTESTEELEEERRIFYVAITRAKNELYMTNVKARRQWGHTEYQNACRFLKDIPETLIVNKTRKAEVSEFGYSGYSNSYYPKTNQSKPSTKSTLLSRNYVNKPIPKFKPVVNLVKYEEGDKIESDSYGKGTVTKIRSAGRRQVMDVTFDNGRKSCFACDRVTFKKL